MRNRLTLVAWLLATNALIGPSAFGITVRTVAVSGTQAPGTPSVFSQFVAGPVLNDSGMVAFRASIEGIATTNANNSGIWSEGNGSGLQLVVREGFPATGAAGALFSDLSQTQDGTFFDPLSMNNRGDIAFNAELSGFGVNAEDKTGIWVERASQLALIARAGNVAPNANARFTYLGDGPRLDESGRIAFLAYIRDDAEPIRSRQSIWSEQSVGSLQLIAGGGRTAGSTGDLFEDFFDPQVNPTGQVAFWTSLRGPGVSELGGSIWSQSPGWGLNLVIRKGDDAPGTDADFLSFGGPSFNQTGHVAFRGSLVGPSVTLGTNGGVWSQGHTGELHLVARTGQVAPGTDVHFRGFHNPVINGRGDSAFFAGLYGADIEDDRGSGLWSESENGLSLIVRSGSAAPGTNGVFSEFPFDPSPVLNGSGQLAFRAMYNVAGESGGIGIWATNSAGDLRLIARTGDTLDVDGGPGADLRTISSLFFGRGSGNEDGISSPFNERGQVVFLASFTDGSSGVFVSNMVVPVPEPPTVVAVVVFLLVVGASSGRRRPSNASGLPDANLGQSQ